jgi:hypothetical protein
MSAETILDREEYSRSVIRMYVSLPETPQRAARNDWIFANKLFDQNVEIQTIKHALLLATFRRLARSPEMPQLSPIRSLHYFLPVIEELLKQPLPAGYPEYLERKVAILAGVTTCIASDPALDHKSTFSRDR